MRLAAHHRPPTPILDHPVRADRLRATPLEARLIERDGGCWLPDADAPAAIRWGLSDARHPAHTLAIGAVIARRLRHAPEQRPRFDAALAWCDRLTRTLEPGPDRFRALRAALVLRDDPAQRAVHVAVLLAGLTRQRAMARQSRIQLALAGLCLDIGATLLPDTATAPMRARHPLLGVDLLAIHTADGLLRSAIAGHHERVDGAGQPVGARALPLAARLAGVCDRAVDQLSAPPIGPLPPPALALERLADDAGAVDRALLIELVRLLARRDADWRSGERKTT